MKKEPKKSLKIEILFTLVLIRMRTNEIAISVPSYPKRVKGWVFENKDQIIFWLIFAINLLIKSLIDVKLTPFFMQNNGYVYSFLATNIIYATIGVASVLAYDLWKKDPLKIEALKRHQSEKGHLKYKNSLIKFILKRNKKNKIILNTLLFFKNPGLMVIYQRDGFNLYNGFAGKNIKFIFLTYLLFMNFYWNTIVYFGIQIWDPILCLIKNLIFWYSTGIKIAPFI